jgi:uncharacterized protein YuzB (UPF0349 family)
MTMDHSILYCFRNRVKECEDEIRKSVVEKETPLSVSPTYCMKLCMFCEGQHVVVVNKKVVIEKNKERLIEKIKETLLLSNS